MKTTMTLMKVCLSGGMFTAVTGVAYADDFVPVEPLQRQAQENVTTTSSIQQATGSQASSSGEPTGVLGRITGQPESEAAKTGFLGDLARVVGQPEQTTQGVTTLGVVMTSKQAGDADIDVKHSQVASLGMQELSDVTEVAVGRSFTANDSTASPSSAITPRIGADD